MPESYKSIWAKCLVILGKEMNKRTYDTWFKPIKPIAFTDDELTIQVPNTFFYEYLEGHFVKNLGAALNRVVGKKCRLKYQILMHDNKDGSSRSDADQTEFIPGTYDRNQIKNPFVVPGIKKQIYHNINAKYTFDNFIEGKYNKLARAAGVAISKDPGKTSFNPFIIHGGVGLGKTHLVYAIGNAIIKDVRRKRVLYVNSDKFTTQVYQAIKHKAADELVSYYQSLDCLIVDDIQFLAGRTKTLELFFHIFNHLHDTGRQIVLTCDRPPKTLSGIEDRLISRFKWGLTADLEKPNLDTRKAILQSKLSVLDIQLEDKLMEYICHNIKDNIRELEGVVISIHAQASLTDAEINESLIKKIVNNHNQTTQKEVTVEGILDIVAEYYSLDVEKMLSSSRKRSIVIPRQLSMFMAKKLTKLPLSKIGAAFGGKDHTTVLYACKQMKNMMETDVNFNEEVASVERMIEMRLS